MLAGKTALVTGSNTGIGKHTARQLLQLGARVIIACRDPNKAELAAQELRSELTPTSHQGLNSVGSRVDPDTLSGRVQVEVLDLASLSSVRECASRLLQRGEKLNILINNAGVMACPYTVTPDGLELQLAVNHTAHFLLTVLLTPALLAAAPSRVVTLSSHAHYAGRMNYKDLNSVESYNPFTAYAQSKLANVLFSKELARRLAGTGVTSYAVHPGVVATELGRHLNKSNSTKTGTISTTGTGKKSMARRLITCMSKTPEEGARTSVFCASQPALAQHSGYYYSNCRRVLTSPLSWGSEPGVKLWKETEKMLDHYLQPF